MSVVVTRNLVKGENKYDIYFLKTLTFISKNKWDKCGALLVCIYSLSIMNICNSNTQYVTI